MRLRLLFPIAALCALSACGDSGDQAGDSSDTTAASSSSSDATTSEGESSGEATSGGETSGSSTGGESGSTEGGSDSGGDSGDGGDEGGSTTSGDGDGDGDGEIEPGQLTAGEYRDLEHWEFWLDLLDGGDESEGPWGSMMESWSMFPLQQYGFLVHDENNRPVVDAWAHLYDASDTLLWSARTDNRGRVYLFGGFEQPLAAQSVATRVEIGSGSASASVAIEGPQAGEPAFVQLTGVPASPGAADIMFMVDTTGSMGDELAYLKSELSHVISNVELNVMNAGDLDAQLRLSVNFYRDVEDDYLVRSFPFTSDVDTALLQLSEQSAAGGGDYPEAVVQAMESGVRDHQWSTNARARIMFLLLDAPPHAGSDSNERLAAMTRLAAEKGIRLIPLACSGTDKNTEFVVRFMDVGTGGTYTFLTDDSGIGGSHIEPSVGEYQVEYLDDLLERLITEAVL